MPGFAHVPAGEEMPLVLRASKGPFIVSRVCRQVTDAAMGLYAEARQLDLYCDRRLDD